MKKKSDDVYRLIDSMSSSEKRYFRLYAGKHKTDTIYIKMFNAINKITKTLQYYDEDKLKEMLRGENVLNYLSPAKLKLRELIVESLRSQEASKNKVVEIRILLDNASIYAARGLYDLSEKALKKARSVIEKSGHNWALIPLLDAERILIHNSRNDKYFDKLDLIDAKMQLAIATLETEYKLQSIYERLFRLVRKGSSKQFQKALSTIETEIQKPYISDMTLTRTFEEQRRVYQIHALFHHLKQDFHQAKFYCRKVVELYNSHIDSANSNSQGYVKALSELAKLLLRGNSKDLAEFRSIIKILKAIPDTNFDDRAELFQNIYFLDLQYILTYEDPAEYTDSIKYIEDGLKKYDPKINQARYLTFNFNLAVAFMLSGQYREAADWLKKIIYNHNPTVRVDIITAAKLLLPFLYFEVREYGLMENSFRSAYRHIKQRQEGREFEQVLKTHLAKLIRFEPDPTESVMYCELLKKLEELQAKQSERPKLGRAALIKWIKLRKCPDSERL